MEKRNKSRHKNRKRTAIGTQKLTKNVLEAVAALVHFLFQMFELQFWKNRVAGNHMKVNILLLFR